jgi:hypothetical protein
MLLKIKARSIGYDVKNGKITIKGEGNSSQSMTTVGDVARFVTHVLTTLPRDQIEWTKFRIEGDRVVCLRFLPITVKLNVTSELDPK